VRNYVKIVIGLDYDPNSAGAPPNVMGIFLDDNDAAGFTGQLYPVYVLLNKLLVIGCLAEIEPFVMQSLIDTAISNGGSMPPSRDNAFELFIGGSPKEWWSNGK